MRTYLYNRIAALVCAIALLGGVCSGAAVYAASSDTGCSANGQGKHSFGSWSKLDKENHTRKCAACSEVQQEAHVWDNGFCAWCSYSAVNIDCAEGKLTVKVPGLPDDGHIIIACYTAEKKQLAAYCPELPVRDDVWLEESILTYPAIVKVFFLNDQCCPTGSAFEYVVSNAGSNENQTPTVPGGFGGL